MQMVNDKVAGAVLVCDYLISLFEESPKGVHTREDVLKVLGLIREDFAGVIQVELVPGDAVSGKDRGVN